MNIPEVLTQASVVAWSAAACLLLSLIFFLRSAVDDDAVSSAQQALEWPSDSDGRVLKPSELGGVSNGRLMCHDPSTLRMLGEAKIFSEAEVKSTIARCKAAQVDWAKTSFGERRRVMRVLLQLVLDNADRIAAVAARDSGKTNLDAMIGEVMTVCEKIRWLIACGEQVIATNVPPVFSFVYVFVSSAPAQRVAQLRAADGLDQDVAHRVQYRPPSLPHCIIVTIWTPSLTVLL